MAGIARSLKAPRRHAFHSSYERRRDVVYVCTCGAAFAHHVYLDRVAVAKIALEAHIDIENETPKEPQKTVSVWVIYDHPLDFPAHFVLREQIARNDGSVQIGPATIHVTLDQARDAVPPGLYRIPRDVSDDVTIVEVWL